MTNTILGTLNEFLTKKYIEPQQPESVVDTDKPQLSMSVM